MRKSSSPKKTVRSPATPRAKPGRPKASSAERSENRELVLSAAERIYARQGYADITVEHLIVEAGISRPTFYRWFSSKDEVLEEIVHRANDALLARIQQAVSLRAELVEKITAGVDAYLQWGIETGPLVLALHREANQQGSPVYKDRKRVGKGMLMLYQQQGKLYEQRSAHPLIYQALIVATEYAGSWLYRKPRVTAIDIDAARQVMLRIVLSTLLDRIDHQYIPPLLSAD